MRILLCVPEYPPNTIGGGGVVFKKLAETYKSLGHEVAVLHGDYSAPGIMENVSCRTENGIRIYRVPDIPCPDQAIFLRTVLPPNPVAFLALPGILDREKPDMVHAHGYGHMFVDIVVLLCILKRIRYVFTSHGMPKLPHEMGGPVALAWEIYRGIIPPMIDRNANAVTCVSQCAKSECERQDAVVVPNGADERCPGISKGALGKLRKEIAPKNMEIVLSVGRLSSKKGFQDIVRVLEKAPHVIYAIAGEDYGYRSELERLAKERGVEKRLVLFGKIEREQMDKYYQISDLVAIPSHQESFGLVGLEALSNRKPIVHSGRGGLGYLVNSKNAHQYRNSRELVQLLKRMPVYRAENFLKRYSWKKVASDYVSIFRRASKA